MFEFSFCKFALPGKADFFLKFENLASLANSKSNGENGDEDARRVRSNILNGLRGYCRVGLPHLQQKKQR